MSGFAFKQFTIHQEGVAMKVGVDGVMLGAWASGPEQVGRILDIGTGTGVIALMLAQRFIQASVMGVEVNPAAASGASDNVARSKWHNRIEIVCADIADFVQHPTAQFDIIVSNPPYFTDGFPVADTGRKWARDTQSLPHMVLATVMYHLLAPAGIASVILPVQEGEQFIQIMQQQQLFLHKHTRVVTKAGKQSKRSLLAFGKTQVPIAEDEIIIHEASGEFSSAYRKLTGDFYLAF